MSRPCKDCNVHSNRPAPHPGPRCATHHREELRRRKEHAHGLRTQSRYGLTPEDYKSLYGAQGGHCAICERSRGVTKRLSVDHEHDRPGCEHPSDQGCYLCVRGLLCAQCNRILIGRYDAEALRRAISYLSDPPARKVLMSS